MGAPSTAVVGQIVTASFWNTEVRDQLTGLRITGSYVSSTTITGAGASEQVVAAVNWTAESTRTYLVIARLAMETTVAGTTAVFRLRSKAGVWAVGSTDMTSTTVLQAVNMEWDAINTLRDYVPLISVTGLSGSVTIGATVVRSAGTGTMNVNAGQSGINMQVLPIGPVT